ncbi:stage III sporulation protein AF [Paenibacillus endophyticus]|uniref:Stage III sporulation protein AF n=1 Tax=Paenibacillus endophyticus TaxID=1294268 RepID=A0A7W5CB88_9BACL|nr:stage III sporulation protein AF [Paenibacillus endophyticus]MBB3154520.1 stage III sporulation protein AF [Paenibacillus endophyticus]
MVAWLSDWLRDIIAVILLAVFVELLLPNKAMQRYARLVVGLFILLTILSPILKLIQSDIGAKLDEGMENWSRLAAADSAQMTGLSQIKQDAEAMSAKRNLEAAKLTERTLEASIRNELIERSDAAVADVDAVLKWVNASGQQTPYLSQVTVTLKATENSSGNVKEGATVEKVQPVIVDVEVEPMEPVSPYSSEPKVKDGQSQAAQVEGNWSRADPAVTAELSSLIAKGWGLNQEQIVVRQPAEGPLQK